MNRRLHPSYTSLFFIIGVFLFASFGTVRAQSDGWDTDRLLFYSVNTEALFHSASAESPFMNMAYGFTVGHSTLHKIGWYVGVMTNFNLFGAFKSVDVNVHELFTPDKRNTSYLEGNFGLNFHPVKPLSLHLGTGYFYRTENYLSHDHQYVHLKGDAGQGILLDLGLTWHIELSHKDLSERSRDKVSLSADFVGLINGNPTDDKRFSFGFKLGIGICSAPKVSRTSEPGLYDEDVPPMIAENKRSQKQEEAAERRAAKAQAKAEKEAAAEAEREAREKAQREAEAKAKAEQEAKEKAEREAREKAEREAAEAKAKAEAEAKAKAEAEAKAKAEAEARAKAEREAREKAEREAAEAKAREVLAIDTELYNLQPGSATIVFTNSKSLSNSPDIKRRGVCYAVTSIESEPTLNNRVIPFTEGSLFQIIDSLTPETQYSVRAFTERTDGSVDYSEAITFFTPLYLNTSEVTDITGSSAVVGGKIMFSIPETITLAGACWSLKNDHPTTANTRSGDVVTNGQWLSSMLNLRPDTVYYVRTYVITASGKVYYGNVVTFRTGKN